MIDWKEAARGIRKRERATKAWWRAYGIDWRDAAMYWMRRAEAAEERVGILEDALRSTRTVQAPLIDNYVGPSDGRPVLPICRECDQSIHLDEQMASNDDGDWHADCANAPRL